MGSMIFDSMVWKWLIIIIYITIVLNRKKKKKLLKNVSIRNVRKFEKSKRKSIIHQSYHISNRILINALFFIHVSFNSGLNVFFIPYSAMCIYVWM